MRDSVTLGSLCYPPFAQINVDSDTIIDYIDISSVDNISKKITGYQTMPFSEAPSRARKSVRKNSIIVSTVRPNLNAVALFENQTSNIPVVSTGFCVLDCKQGVDVGFVFNFCKSKSFIDQVVSQATGASYPAVNDKIIRTVLLPNYTYEKQHLISSTLDKISHIIDYRKQQLQALDDLIKARFVEMFGDGFFPKGIIADLVIGKVSSAKKDFSQDEIIKYIDISSIDNQRNIMTGYTEYVLSEAPSRAQQHIVKDDIVVSTVRPNLRNVAITKFDDNNLVASSGFCILRPKKCLPSYLMAIVCSDEFTSEMSKVVTGANYPAIKDSDVLGYQVSIPPMDLQISFDNFVSQVDKSKVVVQKALDEAQLLFDSLMQEYFG